MEKLDEIIRKHALRNALDYGQAQADSIVGKVLGEAPDAKKDMAGTMALIQKTVTEVNALSKEEREKQVQAYSFIEKAKGRAAEEMPELPFKLSGKIITRMAPNPNGILHIGHAKPAVLNDEYAKKLGGEFWLRLEDTDPKVKKPLPQAYQWIPEDIAWLGCNIAGVVVQSDRIPIYYSYAEKLLTTGKMYVCDCPAETLQKNREKALACTHRDLPASEQLTRWKRMLSFSPNGYPEGGAVARLKTDMKHENSSVRDWPALRIALGEHPRQGQKYRVWPLYNFSAVIDDHEMGVSFVIRGKEHELNAVKQKFLFDALGWVQAPNLEIGILRVPDLMSHKSEIVQGIVEGKYEGWDDIRLPTIRALRRRGIQAQAIRRYMISSGVNASDSTLDWALLFKFNRELLNDTANRYFFVTEPVPLKINGAPAQPMAVELKKHPVADHGTRTLPVNPDEVFISKADAEENAGKIVRLKDLYNVKLAENSEGVTKFAGTEMMKESPKIQWVSTGALPALIFKPDGSTLSGVCEPALASVPEGTVLQFERVGFVRLDKKTPHGLEFWFAH